MSQNINLYDVSLRKRRDVLDFSAALVLLGTAALCVVLGTAAARWSLARVEPVAVTTAAELETEQAEAQALAARVASRRPDADLQAGIAAAQRTLLQRRAALQKIDANGGAGEDGFSARLQSLARQSVDGLWLTTMALRQDDVLLKGRALTPALIPLYVQRLDREASLQGRAFKALDVVRPLDSSAPAASESDASAAPRHAEFVEFTLVGAAQAEPLAADQNGQPLNSEPVRP